MHKLHCFVVCSLALAAPLSNSVSAQGSGSTGRDGGWLYFGLGSGYPYTTGAVVSVNIGRAPAYQLAFNTITELQFGPEGTPPSVHSVGPSIGYSAVNRVGRVALFAGPAFVWGWDEIDRYPWQERYYTAGLTLNAQLFLTPLPEFGAGIDFFGNLNPVTPAMGIRLTVLIEGQK